MMDQLLRVQTRVPETPGEWDQYYNLRWRVLREPWGQPLGSERDELDLQSFHAAIWDGVMPVAVGRLHFNSPLEAQVRYMAVDPNWQGQQLGSRILSLLEARAQSAGAQRVVLNAREDAAGFYHRHGYSVTGPAGLLFGAIPHLQMLKRLDDVTRMPND